MFGSIPNLIDLLASRHLCHFLAIFAAKIFLHLPGEDHESFNRKERKGPLQRSQTKPDQDYAVLSALINNFTVLN